MRLIARLSALARAQLGSLTGRSRPGAFSGEADAGRKESRTGRQPTPAAQDSLLAGYYANLELPYGAGPEQVKAARKRLMKKYHPDLHGRDPAKQQVATELIKGINHAHDMLLQHLEKKG